MTTPSGLSRMRHAGDEVVEVGHLRQHVVADDEVGLRALGDQLLGEPRAEEIDAASGRPSRRPRFGDVGRRLDAEHGHAERQEVLQQIAVVAGQLDHQAVGRRGRAAP